MNWVCKEAGHTHTHWIIAKDFVRLKFCWDCCLHFYVIIKIDGFDRQRRGLLPHFDLVQRLDCNLIENQIHWDLLIRICATCLPTTGTNVFFVGRICSHVFSSVNERAQQVSHYWLRSAYGLEYPGNVANEIFSCRAKDADEENTAPALFILVLNMEFQFGKYGKISGARHQRNQYHIGKLCIS